MEFFNVLGIRVITGAYGKVSDVLNQFTSGNLVSREYRPSKKWEDCHGKEECT